MYCSSCGVAVTQGLPYCNYCGAKLSTGDSGDKPPDTRPAGLVGGLVTMMVATFVMGLFAITIFMGVMKTVIHLDTGAMLGFTSLSFLIMLMLEGIFIRLLFRPIKHHDSELRNTFQNNRASTKELEAQSRLPMEPVSSVTEHTTRAFDTIYSERK
jgi:predicted lipid-binding transport protein (Tim44 family)